MKKPTALFILTLIGAWIGFFFLSEPLLRWTIPESHTVTHWIILNVIGIIGLTLLFFFGTLTAYLVLKSTGNVERSKNLLTMTKISGAILAIVLLIGLVGII